MPLSFRQWTSGRKRGNEPITGRSWQGITRCAACKGGATPGLNVFTPVVPWVGIRGVISPHAAAGWSVCDGQEMASGSLDWKRLCQHSRPSIVWWMRSEEVMSYVSVL